MAQRRLTTSQRALRPAPKARPATEPWGPPTPQGPLTPQQQEQLPPISTQDVGGPGYIPSLHPAPPMPNRPGVPELEPRPGQGQGQEQTPSFAQYPFPFSYDPTQWKSGTGGGMPQTAQGGKPPARQALGAQAPATPTAGQQRRSAAIQKAGGSAPADAGWEPPQGVFDPAAALGGVAGAATGGLQPSQPQPSQAQGQGAGPFPAPAAQPMMGAVTPEQLNAMMGRTQPLENPITSAMRAQTGMDAYGAQMQAAQTNREQALEGLARMEREGGEVPDRILGRAALSRGRMDQITSREDQRLAANRQGVTDASRALIEAAQSREDRIGALAEGYREQMLNDYQDQAALDAQQLVIGGRAARGRRMEQLDSMIASGQVTAGRATAMRQIVDQGYSDSLGSAIARAATAYNGQRAQLNLASSQMVLGIESAMAGQAVGAYGTAAQLEAKMADVESQFRRTALAERASHENGIVQMEAMAERLRLQGANDQAAFLTSPAMMAYAGDLSPLVNSVWQMYEDELAQMGQVQQGGTFDWTQQMWPTG